MYSFDDYGQMIADRVRMDAYAYTLKSVIQPGSTVVDIGTGAGIHALLACKFGANKVYAIEPNDIIHLAEEMAASNGFADRITFIQDRSTDVTLPEQVDVCVSDLRGVLPLFEAHIPAVVDARQRFLKPGGVLIPQQDRLWIALVESRRIYRQLIEPWDLPYGLDMGEAKQIVLNRFSQDNTDFLRRGSLLMEPYHWATLDYASIEDPGARATHISKRVRRDGIAHGLLVWFDTELAPEIGFSNGLDKRDITEVYGRAFFPLLEPVSVIAGDTVILEIEAELVEDTYDWRWQTLIHHQDNPGKIKAEYLQSTEFFPDYF